MKMRFTRGVIIASAMGLVMSGGAVQAAGSSPDVPVQWKEGEPAPFAATRFDGEVVGKKVYFLGFRAADDSTDGSIWYYNIRKKKYVDTGDDMPVPISNYTIAALKDKTGLGLYTFGGRDAAGKILTTVQVYYPATGESKVLKDDRWPGKTPSDCTSLPATGVAVVGNTAYVMGGVSFAASGCLDDTSKQVWSFDAKGNKGKKWTKQPSLNVARGYLMPTVIGDKIYAIGGDVNEAGSLIAQAAVEAWKVGANAWNDANFADLPQPCDESQAFGFESGELGGTITLAGCGQWPNALPDVLQYKVERDTWSVVGALNEARRNHAGANIGSASAPKLFVLGGYNADSSATLMTSEIGTAGPATGDAPQAPPVGPVPGARPSAL